jgi:hypothetical protein
MYHLELKPKSSEFLVLIFSDKAISSKKRERKQSMFAVEEMEGVVSLKSVCFTFRSRTIGKLIVNRWPDIVRRNVPGLEPDIGHSAFNSKGFH